MSPVFDILSTPLQVVDHIIQLSDFVSVVIRLIRHFSNLMCHFADQLKIVQSKNFLKVQKSDLLLLIVQVLDLLLEDVVLTHLENHYLSFSFNFQGHKPS